MSHAASQILPAPTRSPKRPRGLPFPKPFRAPTIRTLPATDDDSLPVPVVIMPPRRGPVAEIVRSPARVRGCFRPDLSWMAALFVALSVLLALAIPLQLVQQ